MHISNRKILQFFNNAELFDEEKTLERHSIHK